MFRARIVVTVSFIETLTTFIIILLSVIYYYNSHYNQLEIRASEVSRLLLVALTESLTIGNYSSVGEIADTAFFEIPGLDFILIINEDGTEIARKQRGRNLTSKNHLAIDNTISIGNNIIALFTINYCIDELYNDLYRYIITLISLAIVGVATSNIILYSILTRISNIISSVSEGVEDIESGRVPNLMPKQRNDELGKLVDNYNSLIELARQRTTNDRRKAKNS